MSLLDFCLEFESDQSSFGSSAQHTIASPFCIATDLWERSFGSSAVKEEKGSMECNTNVRVCVFDTNIAQRFADLARGRVPVTVEHSLVMLLR